MPPSPTHERLYPNYWIDSSGNVWFTCTCDTRCIRDESTVTRTSHLVTTIYDCPSCGAVWEFSLERLHALEGDPTRKPDLGSVRVSLPT